MLGLIPGEEPSRELKVVWRILRKSEGLENKGGRLPYTHYKKAFAKFMGVVGFV